MSICLLFRNYLFEFVPHGRQIYWDFYFSLNIKKPFNKI